jgi:O-antigen/teichoic acid export membrane protein
VGFFQISIANLVAAGLNGALWLVLASVLSPAEYGKINYFISIASIGSIVGTFGVNTLNITSIAKNAQIESDGMYTFVFILTSFISIALGALSQSPITGLLCFSLTAFSMSIAIPVGRKEYANYMKIVIGSRSLLIIFSLISFFFFGLNGILVSYCISLLIFSKGFLHRLIKSKLRTDGFSRENIKFSFHSFFMNFAQSSNLYIDKIIIAPLYGFYLLGLYQISTQFLMLLAILPSSLFLYLLPKEVQGYSSIRLTTGAVLLAVIFSVTLFFSGDIILQHLFPNFVAAGEIVKIVTFGAIPMTFVASFNSKLLGAEKSNYVFVGAMVFLITLLSLLLVFRTFNNGVLIGLSLVLALSAQAIFLWVGERTLHGLHFKRVGNIR